MSAWARQKSGGVRWVGVWKHFFALGFCGRRAVTFLPRRK